jgi:hypothetical protein
MVLRSPRKIKREPTPTPTVSPRFAPTKAIIKTEQETSDIDAPKLPECCLKRNDHILRLCGALEKSQQELAKYRQQVEQWESMGETTSAALKQAALRIDNIASNLDDGI